MARPRRVSQPLQPLILARRLAPALRDDRGVRAGPGQTLDRQQPWEGASLGGGLEKGERQEAIGRSRGGRTSKIHRLADERGRPVVFAPTPGNVADISLAIPRLEVAAPSRRLIADKAQDADRLRRRLDERRSKAVIPSTASRKTPDPLDPRACRRRNVLERLFCRLKTWRRVATRYDRHAATSLAAIAHVAALSKWRVRGLNLGSKPNHHFEIVLNVVLCRGMEGHDGEWVLAERCAMSGDRTASAEEPARRAAGR